MDMHRQVQRLLLHWCFVASFSSQQAGIKNYKSGRKKWNNSGRFRIPVPVPVEAWRSTSVDGSCVFPVRCLTPAPLKMHFAANRSGCLISSNLTPPPLHPRPHLNPEPAVAAAAAAIFLDEIWNWGSEGGNRQSAQQNSEWWCLTPGLSLRDRGVQGEMRCGTGGEQAGAKLGGGKQTHTDNACIIVCVFCPDFISSWQSGVWEDKNKAKPHLFLNCKDRSWKNGRRRYYFSSISV